MTFLCCQKLIDLEVCYICQRRTDQDKNTREILSRTFEKTQAYQTICLEITARQVNDEKKTRLNRFPKLPTRLSVRNEIGD